MSMSSVSALGSNQDAIWNNYLKPNHLLKLKKFDKFEAIVSEIDNTVQKEIDAFISKDIKYRKLDRSVVLAMFVADKSVSKTIWKDKDIGINFGSSRGATSLFEKYYESYKNHKDGTAETLSSPTTTLGNISSWVAHDLKTNGPTISHSITCSTAMHSILNAVAWLGSGMSRQFVAGGSEAANTGFTIAQMKALKVYSQSNDEFPCKSLDFTKTKNTMVIGEAAIAFCMEKGIQKDAIAYINAVGYATEVLTHGTSISTEAICFQDSMKMALEGSDIEDVDIVVMHAPGTIKGDSSEYKAIDKVFEGNMPAITSNKWKIGHTLGSSGTMSLEFAIMMLTNQKFIDIPYLDNQKQPNKIKNILVNSVGFGGNAVSLLVSV